MRLARFIWALAPVVLLAGCGSSGSSSGAGPASTATSPTSSPASSSSGSNSSGSGSSTTGGNATLSWTAPTLNSDGSALTDLAGYYVYYGNGANSLTNMITVSSPSALSYTISNLSTGTWYFAVSAYTSSGAMSAMSTVG